MNFLFEFKKRLIYGFVMASASLAAVNASSLSNTVQDIGAYNQNMINYQMAAAKEAISQHEDQWKRLQFKKYHQAFNQLGVKQEAQQGVMIFVTLSMPTFTLRQILMQAARLHIPVMIRGLVNNDFATTRKRVAQIITLKNQTVVSGGVEMNPIWFRQFHINEVPAFVAYKRSPNCEAGDICADTKFDVLSGNISVDQALQILSNKHKDVSGSIASGYLVKSEISKWSDVLHSSQA